MSGSSGILRWSTSPGSILRVRPDHLPLEEQLRSGASRFAQRAARDFLDGDREAYLIHAGTALEHLLKAFLAATDPILVADGRNVRTVRTECLDHVLILGRGHLDRVLRTYVGHYTEQRPHRGLNLATPAGMNSPSTRGRGERQVARKSLLGGLIHEYRWAA